MYRGGGGPESGRKKFEKCLPAGTGTKIYFSSSFRKISGDLAIAIVRFWRTKPKIITSHDILEPPKQALWASRDVMIPRQIGGLQNKHFGHHVV